MSSWTWEAAGFTSIALHSSVFFSYADWISHLSLNPRWPTQWWVSNVQRSSLRRLFGISCQDVYGKILNQIKAWQIRQSCLYEGEKCSYEVRNITANTRGANSVVQRLPAQMASSCFHTLPRSALRVYGIITRTTASRLVFPDCKWNAVNSNMTPFLAPNSHFWSEWNTLLAHQN